MSERRWAAGDTFQMCGVQWRVVRGRYLPGDLRLEWQINGRWVAVQMLLGAVMADFFGDNESHLYPPPALGWRKYAQWIALAAHQGWVPAQHQMLAEREKRHAQQSQGLR